MEKEKKLVSSKEAKKMANLKSCDLMHYRQQGKLDFEKRGNAFFYSEESVKKLKKIK
ncbi:MerR family transcriptional regulator [uncultured Psychroserpens sp.]|uniref:MerR family transcriptional regulator n=1 Tax=uncultured Psychroserpens sp. TaxID=255436 RepID=UPI002623108A|nr:MerR family transcriptional regulator [uncultured Psychroserpens sp.]